MKCKRTWFWPSAFATCTRYVNFVTDFKAYTHKKSYFLPLSSYLAKHYTDFVTDISQTGDGYYRIILHTDILCDILDSSDFISLLHAILNRYEIRM